MSTNQDVPSYVSVFTPLFTSTYVYNKQRRHKTYEDNCVGKVLYTELLGFRTLYIVRILHN
jgi:hypothetical protein